MEDRTNRRAARMKMNKTERNADSRMQRYMPKPPNRRGFEEQRAAQNPIVKDRPAHTGHGVGSLVEEPTGRNDRAAKEAESFEELAASLNLHDLCEVPLPKGRIAPSALIRCAKFDGISSNNWHMLMEACNFGLVIDLRTNAEIPQHSGVLSPGAKSTCIPCATASLPLEGLGLLMPSWQRPFGPAWVYMRKKLWADPLPMFKKMYAALVLDSNNMRNMNRFFQLALAPRNGALVWHCAQGTDRTGIIAALLLEVLGADRSEIVEHYAACYAHSAPADPRPQLLAAYDAIEHAFGSIEAYLTQGVGLTPSMQKSLKERFLL